MKVNYCIFNRKSMCAKFSPKWSILFFIMSSCRKANCKNICSSQEYNGEVAWIWNQILSVSFQIVIVSNTHMCVSVCESPTKLELDKDNYWKFYFKSYSLTGWVKKGQTWLNLPWYITFTLFHQWTFLMKFQLYLRFVFVSVCTVQFCSVHCTLYSSLSSKYESDCYMYTSPCFPPHSLKITMKN